MVLRLEGGSQFRLEGGGGGEASPGVNVSLASPGTHHTLKTSPEAAWRMRNVSSYCPNLTLNPEFTKVVSTSFPLFSVFPP